MSKDIEEYSEERAIESAVDIAKEMKMTDQQIEKYLMKKFNISKDVAKKYIETVHA